MNAEKFFEKYSIEEISKKTKISPISLRFIRNKEFEKIPRAKFFGFIKIIEKEFKVDLSDLKDEYQSLNPQKEEHSQEIKIEKNSKNPLLIILAVILLILGGYILYKNTKKQTTPIESNISKNIENFKIDTPENNSTQLIKQPQNQNMKISTPNCDINQSTLVKTQTNNSKKEIKKSLQKYPIEIIPKQTVWFRIKNIDTNETKEYLTSNIKKFPKGNYYIKFGHGNIIINYNNQTITPNTKNIVRILFKDGNYTFLKKQNRYEK